MFVKANLPSRQQLVVANEAEYGVLSPDMNWVTPEKAETAEQERSALLAAMDTAVTQSCNRTKPHLGPLSPGCKICTEGGWSCLFINGKCNCRCFYCPTTQDSISVPTTNRIPFRRPKDYVAYIRHFGFRGVSISGGEPLLTFEQSLRYIEAVRKSAGDALHIWLYTNSTLLTAERAQALKAAGLNELRFDLSAVNYDVNRIALAAGTIDCITVEIPAIPEDREKLKALLPQLHDAGVNHLNLHQLRLTPFNSAKLLMHPYTFLHGEKVTVLESESTALALMDHARAEKIELPINYCSFVYKHFYQRAAARRRSAPHISQPYESVTPSGFIRCLTLSGSEEALARQAERFESAGADRSTWSLSAKKDRLFFHERLWSQVDFTGLEIKAAYSEALLSAQNSYRRLFKEIKLTPKFHLFVEKQPHLSDTLLSESGRLQLEKALQSTSSNESEPANPLPEEILAYEATRRGLQEYF